MNVSRWARLRLVPVSATLGLLLCTAGGMSGGTCINVPGVTPDNTTGTPSTSSPLPSLPPATQPDTGAGNNTPPSITFGWPTAPVSIQAGTILTIQWTVRDVEDAARVSISARDSFGSDVVLASGVPGTVPQSTHTYAWNTATLGSGTYRIVALVNDGHNPAVSVIAPGDVTILPRPPTPVTPPPPPPPPDTPPTITFSAPAFDATANAGDPVQITWSTRDFESAVFLTLLADADTNDANTNALTILTKTVPFSATVVNDSFTWLTSVAPGVYRIIGQVDDGTGLTGHVVRREAVGKITIIPVGTGSQNGAPSASISSPTADIGLSQGDQLAVIFSVRDPDASLIGGNKDTLTITFYFDRDLDPTNDVADPPIQIDTGQLPSDSIPANTDFAFAVAFVVDTTVTPVREETDEGGRPLPYYIRIKVDDGEGGVVNAYAVGTARVLGSASDVVDLQAAGGTVSGARFQGFNGEPFAEARGSRAGGAFAAMGDMDGDLIDDFAIASSTGSPGNNNNVGIAYVIYGRERTLQTLAGGRFAGVISLNTVGTFVDFPPTDPFFESIFKIRGTQLYQPGVGGQGSLGITSMVAWPDITGDFTPELVIGSPFNDSARDFEDDDPCDTCTYPAPPDPDSRGEILCMVDPTFVPDTTSSIDNIPALPVLAGTWFGGNGINDSPDNNPPAVPNIDLDLADKRVIPGGMAEIRIRVEGNVTGAAASQTIPVTLTVQLEYNVDTGIANPGAPPPTLIINGPQVVASFNVTTDAQGAADVIQDVRFVPAAQQMPTTTAAPPATPNTSPTPGQIPISAWDGQFNVLIKPGGASMVITAVEAHMAAVLATQETHLFAVDYQDGFPNNRSSVPGCDTTTPVPVDLLGAGELPPAIPPFNDDRFSNINTSGYLCSDLPFARISGGTGAQVADDDIYNPGDGNTNPYQSGLVFICAGDDMTLFATNGFFWPFGLRTANVAGFGQGPQSDNFRGARFRGAWWNTSGIYDPNSMFGQTVDVIPDFADPNGTTGLQELMISAPNAAAPVGVNSAVATLGALAGAYTAGQSRTTGYVLTDPQGAGLLFSSFSQVTSASLVVTGTATRGARLRAELVGAAVPGNVDTARDILLWSGDIDANNDQELSEFFNAAFPFTLAATAQQMNFTRAAMPFMTAVDTTGAGATQIRLTFLDPTTATHHSGQAYPGPIDVATVTINSVQLRVSGIVGSAGGVGEVTIYEGIDWTNDPSGDGNDTDGGSAPPMSWPGVVCTPGITRTFDPANGNGPRQIVTTLTGENFGDQFGWAHNAGDVNQDGEFDFACGSPGSDNNPLAPGAPFDVPGTNGALNNNGKSFLVYGTPVLPSGVVGQAIHLERFEIRGTHDNDAFGKVQGAGGDFGGDSAPDAYVGAPLYDNDGKISNVAATGADAGFVGVLFGAASLTGERTVSCERIGTGNFFGCKFVGGSAGALLGDAVSSAGDFNLDGKGDLLITAPGQTWPGARVIFKGPVLNGDKITINGKVFEFDTDASVAAGSIAVDVSGLDAAGALRTLPASAEAELRKAMKTVATDQLGISALLSRTKFPPPIPNDPTTIFLARRPTVFSVSTTGINVNVETFIRQGATYLIFGAGSTDLVNKTFVLPDDLNRVVAGKRIVKGVAFVSAYERNDPRDLSDPEGADAGSITVNFDPGSVQIADAAPYATFAGGTEQVIGTAGLLSSGTQGYRVLSGTDATITFAKPNGQPAPVCQMSAFFVFDAMSGATGATMTAFDPDGIPVNQVSAKAATTFGDPTRFVSLTSEGAIASIVIHVNGPANSVAVVDSFKFNDATPDEAPVSVVSAIGDVDNDGFPDIILGAPRADFINILEPCNRRKAAGEAYLIYGNNFGLNDSTNP